MYDIQVIDGTVQLMMAEKVYTDDAVALREILFPYIEKGHIRFRFDMSLLEYIDSSGLGILLVIQKKVAKLGGDVTISGLHGDIGKLFELTKLTELFRME
jgi:anti-sigma B factor antagonist